MADMLTQHNISALISPRLALALTSIVAGGSGNNVAITGPALDRSALNMPTNAELTIPFTATLAATKTLSINALNILHSVDGITWTTWATPAAPGVVATGPTGGATISGQVNCQVNLDGANEFVAVQLTPVLSNTATDTAIVGGVLIFAGASPLPAL